MFNQFRRLRKTFRRKVGLETFIATLGDENGVIDEPGFPGYVRIRYTQADGLAQPTTVLFAATMIKQPGNLCEIGYTSDGDLAVLRPYVKGQIASGFNTLGNNPLDPNAAFFIEQARLLPLLSNPVSSSADSMLVTVQPFLYFLSGTVHFFVGGNGDVSGDSVTPIDLTASIPGSASQQCLACLFLSTTDDTVFVETSTPVTSPNDLGLDSVQECIDATAPTTDIPIFAYRLYHGQTGIKTGSLTTGGDEYLDLRVFVNTPSTGGGSGDIVIPINRSWFGI